MWQKVIGWEGVDALYGKHGYKRHPPYITKRRIGTKEAIFARQNLFSDFSKAGVSWSELSVDTGEFRFLLFLFMDPYDSGSATWNIEFLEFVLIFFFITFFIALQFVRLFAIQILDLILDLLFFLCCLDFFFFLVLDNWLDFLRCDFRI